MEQDFKQDKYKILSVIATGCLGLIAVISAIKLYQIGSKPIAPTAPRIVPASEPAAECKLAFTVPLEGTTPTPSPTPSFYCTIQENPTGVLSPLGHKTLTIIPVGGTSYTYDWGSPLIC